MTDPDYFEAKAKPIFSFPGGEAVDAPLPRMSLVIKRVDYRGQKLSVLVERSEGCTDRFERVLVPVPSIEGYMDAAVDYMTEVIKLSMRLASDIWNDACANQAKERFVHKPMKSEHINADGSFQSDKYPWCLSGFVPLKLTDPMAQPLLWDYACRREVVDEQFSKDLRTCLTLAGHDGLRPCLEPVRRGGPYAEQYEGKSFGDVQRDGHGARIIYWEQFPADQVRLTFLDRTGKKVDPDAGADIWSHCFMASARGISEHAVAYVVLFNDSEDDPDIARLDYSLAYSFRLPGGKKLADFDTIQIGYHNMELRGSPPPGMPGAMQPK